MPHSFFVVEVLVFQVIEVICVRLGVLLLAKLNLLCLEMLVATFFGLQLILFYKTRNLFLKILDLPLILIVCVCVGCLHLQTVLVCHPWFGS